jgi:hypothetical protein
MKMTGLNMRVGIEGFFCIVRNTPDYHMEPKWYFSSEALKDYMKIAVPIHKGWDISHVGAKLEAFAVAGCDPVSKSLRFLPILDCFLFWMARSLPYIKAESRQHETADPREDCQNAWCVPF